MCVCVIGLTGRPTYRPPKRDNEGAAERRTSGKPIERGKLEPSSCLRHHWNSFNLRHSHCSCNDEKTKTAQKNDGSKQKNDEKLFKNFVNRKAN